MWMNVWKYEWLKWIKPLCKYTCTNADCESNFCINVRLSVCLQIMDEYKSTHVFLLWSCLEVFKYLCIFMDEWIMDECTNTHECICVSLNVSMNAFMDGWKCQMMIQASINVWNNVSCMWQDVLIQLILVETGRHWFDRLAKKNCGLAKIYNFAKSCKKLKATVMSCGFHKKIANKFQVWSSIGIVHF